MVLAGREDLGALALDPEWLRALVGQCIRRGRFGRNRRRSGWTGLCSATGLWRGTTWVWEPARSCSGRVDARSGRGSGPSRPVRAGQRGRGAPRYEKNKEVALKGYSVPRFGGPQIPQGDVPITKTITVTEGISVKDLAEKLDVRGKDLIATLLMKA